MKKDKTISPNQEAINLQKKIERLEKRSDKINDEICNLKNNLKLICIHNRTEKGHKYESGSYYDREVFINQIVCKDCGKITNVLKKYLEDKPYLYYDQGMYPTWVTKDELIRLITNDLLNDEYNEEIIEPIYCYYDNKENNKRNSEEK